MITALANITSTYLVVQWIIYISSGEYYLYISSSTMDASISGYVYLLFDSEKAVRSLL